MKKLIFLILILFPSLVLAYDVEDNFSISEDNLPYSGSVTSVLTLKENYTIFFNQLQSNEFVNLTFPSNITLTDKPYTNFTVNYTVKSFHPYQTVQILTTSINISNNYNYSISSTYGLLFKVQQNDTYFKQNTTYNWYLVESGYNVTISEDLLPRKSSFIFKMLGVSNITLNITSCDSWLTCQSNITFVNNQTDLKIEYLVPFNTTPGIYEKKFILNGSNMTREGKITFNIIKASILFKKFVWGDECFTTDGTVKLSCIKEFEDFNDRKYAEIWEIAFKQSKANFTEVKEVEKLVMTGSIDAELKKLYDSCLLDKDNSNKRTETCNIQLNSCLETKKSANDQLSKFKQDLVNEKEKINKEGQSLKLDAENKIKSTRNNVIAFTIIAILIIIYLVYYKKLNHKYPWG